MKRILPLVLSSLVLASCGGGGSNGFTPTPELQALADCTGLSIEELGEIYGELYQLITALGGTIPPGDIYAYDTGVYTIPLTIGTLTGVIAPAPDLIDGLGVGELATATLELNGGLAGSSATGEGSLTFARSSATIYNVSGNGELLDGTCQFTFSGLNFTTDDGAIPFGTITFTVTAPEGTLNGTVTLNGTNTARVVATFDGSTVIFFIDLITYEITF